MSPEYFNLAANRAAAWRPPYRQPEDFGYDFREWVSPYTKGACKPGGIALVLQDWASVDGLADGPDPAVQNLGRMPALQTNVRLEHLLRQVFGLRLQETYATNAFPFVKPGGMSAPIPVSEVRHSVNTFTVPALRLARPTLILSLGSVAFTALTEAGIKTVQLPHPAARIGGHAEHESAWRNALRGQVSSLDL
jgi:uracil-DNA glycosylase